MSDGYEFWREGLKGNIGPIHDGDPQPGFYVKPFRKGNEKRPDEQPATVAIWRDADGAMCCLKNGKTHRPDTIWTWVAQYPISHAVFLEIERTGIFPEQFLPRAKAEPEPMKEPEEAPIPQPVMNRPVSLPAGGSDNTSPPPGIGHNSSRAMGEEFAEQMKAEAVLVKELTAEEVTSQEQADKLGEAGNRILKLKKDAEAERKKLKEPHVKAGKAVDAAFKPITEAADTQVKKLREVVGVWNAKEQARLEEIARKEAAEKQRLEQEQYEREKAEAEAERQRLQDEADREAREKAELSGASPEEIAQAKGETVEAPKVKEAKDVKAKKVNVRTGAATGGRSFGKAAKQYGAKITDFDVLLKELTKMPDFLDHIQQIANRHARENNPLPGTERIELTPQQEAAE